MSDLEQLVDNPGNPWGDRPLGREDILTTGQVAELLGLREGTIEDYARRDLLPSFKLGKHRRFIRAQGRGPDRRATRSGG